MTLTLSDSDVILWCPDCGEYLWDDKSKDFLDECTKCGWPSPDYILQVVDGQTIMIEQ